MFEKQIADLQRLDELCENCSISPVAAAEKLKAIIAELTADEITLSQA